MNKLQVIVGGLVTMKGKPKEDGNVSLQVSGMTATGAFNFWLKGPIQQVASVTKGSTIEALCECELTFEGALKPAKILKLSASGPQSAAA